MTAGMTSNRGCSLRVRANLRTSLATKYAQLAFMVHRLKPGGASARGLGSFTGNAACKTTMDEGDTV